MQLTVFFNPIELSAVEAPANGVYIVIDVMRATTTLAVMFDSGAKRVLAAQTLEQAREAAQKVPSRLLCGERHAKTPPGFQYGNSPVQFSQLDLTEAELVLTTSNGTRALFACPEQSTRLAGSFYNARTVALHALRLAQQRGADIFLVCAAEYGYFALEDSTCAGYIVRELLHLDANLTLSDNGLAAISLYENFPPERLSRAAQSAHELISVGQEQDLAFCLQKNASTSVPMVVGRDPETGLLLLDPLQPPNSSAIHPS